MVKGGVKQKKKITSKKGGAFSSKKSRIQDESIVDLSDVKESVSSIFPLQFIRAFSVLSVWARMDLFGSHGSGLRSTGPFLF